MFGRRYFAFILLVLLPISRMWAQFGNTNSTAFQQQTSQTEESTPDSISVKYFYLQDITKKFDFSDTILSINTHAYDPSRILNAEYFNLGNAGSAAFPIIDNKQIFLGTNYGYRSYDIYRLSNRGFRYYEVNRPFFDFSFTPVGGQKNFVIKTDFARNFSDGISLSINYDRINQEGFYQSQDVLHTNFGMGIWYHHPNNKRDLFFTFKNEINTETHNGGVTTREAFSDAFANERMSIAVNINSAATRFQHRSYELSHTLRFQDSLYKESGIELVSDLSLHNGYYKYSDESVSQDVGFYGDFYIDSRGIRNYLGYTKIRTSHIIKGNLIKGLSGNIGFDFTHHSLNQDITTISKNDFFLKGVLTLPISSAFNVETSGHVGLGSATGEFLLGGKTKIKLPKNIFLDADLSIYRNRHSLLANTLFVNGENIWNNDFARPFGTIIKSKIKFPFLTLAIGFKQSLENNSLYWNESSVPVLYDGVYTSSVLDLEFSFKLWKFNFHNYAAGQLFNNNIYNLPRYYSKNQIYWQSRLFNGNMDLRLGAEGRIIGPHQRINFNPLLSVFYSGVEEEDLYPLVDGYLAARIGQFRFFVRFENLGSYINDRIYFQIGDYPQFDRKIRLGIKWQLYD